MQNERVQPSPLEITTQASQLQTDQLRCPYCHDSVSTGTTCAKCTAVYHTECISSTAHACVIPGCKQPLGKRLEVALLEEKISEDTIINLDKFKFPENLRNEVIAYDGNEKYVYAGLACDITQPRLSFNTILARPHILKYKRTEITKKTFSIAKIFSAKATHKQTAITDTEVWHFQGEFSLFVDSTGTPRKKYENANDYRKCLVDAAYKQGIRLTHELFEAAFNPIEEILVAKWHEYQKLLKKYQERLSY